MYMYTCSGFAVKCTPYQSCKKKVVTTTKEWWSGRRSQSPGGRVLRWPLSSVGNTRILRIRESRLPLAWGNPDCLGWPLLPSQARCSPATPQLPCAALSAGLVPSSPRHHPALTTQSCALALMISLLPLRPKCRPWKQNLTQDCSRCLQRAARVRWQAGKGLPSRSLP